MPFMEITWLQPLLILWQQAFEIWLSGGWAMVAIAMVALVMFALGINSYLRLVSKGYSSIPEKTWREWIERPEKRCGAVGEILNTVTGAGFQMKELSAIFDELRTTEITPFERDLDVMKKCVSAAPLLGLLGTVTGMLTTFSALSIGAGGDETMALVAEGISEALVTTETGLVIALPGLFFQYQLSRKLEQYKAFLAHLETVCTQLAYKQSRQTNRVQLVH